MDDSPVMRSYTRAFKVPVLIGRIQGFRLPGGPYTLAQTVLATVVFLAAIFTRSMWTLGSAVDFLAAAVVAIPVGVLAGKISFGVRDPLSVIASLFAGATSPRFGVHRGEPLRWERHGVLTRRLEQARAHTVVLVLADEVTTRRAPTRPAPPAAAGTSATGRAAAPVLPGAREAARLRPAAGLVCPAGPVTAVGRLLAAAEKVS